MKTCIRIGGVLIIAVLLSCAFCGCSKIMKRGGPVTKPSLKIGGDPWAQMAEKRKALSSYEMTMDVEGKPITMTMKFENGKPLRMKMQLGEGTYMYILRDKNEQYMYNEKTKSAMKIPMKPESAAPGAPKIPDISDLKAKSPNVKSDSVDGVDCWLIETPGPDGKMVQSWVDKEYGLPRQEILGDKTIKFSYKDINSVPDSAFELPAGTKIQDMSQMMPGKPSAPKTTLTLPVRPPKAPAMPKLPGG